MVRSQYLLLALVLYTCSKNLLIQNFSQLLSVCLLVVLYDVIICIINFLNSFLQIIIDCFTSEPIYMSITFF